MSTPEAATREYREPTLDDALTIDQMIARLEQFKAELPRGGDTPLIMTDCEPVVYAGIAHQALTSGPAVVLSDRFNDYQPGTRRGNSTRRSHGQEAHAAGEVPGERQTGSGRPSGETRTSLRFDAQTLRAEGRPGE